MSKINFKSFLEKLRFRYKFSLLNENTLGEVWFIRLSRLTVFLLVFLLFVVLFVINSFLLLETPLRKFTPGHIDSEIRTQLLDESFKTDSLFEELKMQEKYIGMIRRLMTGEIMVDSLLPYDSVAAKQNGEVQPIEKTDREKEFAENFENEEKYNLSVLETDRHEDVLILYPPTTGMITEKFQLKKHYGIDIVTKENESILAVTDGTVIFTGYTIDEAYVIQIQHSNNLISIYKQNSEILKKVGDQVKAGESIGIAGAYKKAEEAGQLHFELWRDGKPLNPEQYIIF